MHRNVRLVLLASILQLVDRQNAFLALLTPFPLQRDQLLVKGVTKQQNTHRQVLHHVIPSQCAVLLTIMKKRLRATQPQIPKLLSTNGLNQKSVEKSQVQSLFYLLTKP
jgi:hypothetical protein